MTFGQFFGPSGASAAASPGHAPASPAVAPPAAAPASSSTADPSAAPAPTSVINSTPAPADATAGLSPEAFFGATAPASASASGKAAAPSPSPAPSGIGANVAAGAAEGAGDVLDAGRQFVGSSLAGQALGYLAPFLGQTGKAVGQALATPANTAIDTAARQNGITAPGDVPASTLPEQVARIGTRGAVGALPFGLEGGAATLARTAVGGATGALGGAAAQSVAPDNLKSLAGLVGSVAGGALPAGLEAAGRSVGGAVADRVASVAQPVVGRPAPILDSTGRPFLMSDIVGDPSALQTLQFTPGQQAIAGSRLVAAATNPSAAMDAMANAKPLVPGSQPTTYQATLDPGLGQVESAAASRNRDIFVTRANQQQAARESYLQEGAGNGDPAAVGQLAKSALGDIQTASENQVADLRSKAQAAADAVGGQVPASTDGQTALQSFGAAMRDPLDQANQAAKAQVARVFQAVDPNGTARFDMSAVKDRAAALTSAMGPNAAPLSGEEAAIFDRAASMPAVQSSSDWQDLDSRIGAAMRAARIDPAQAQTYGRLSQLKNSMHQAVAVTVARAAADDPELAGRMEGLSRGGGVQDSAPIAVGQDYGGASAQAPGAQPVGASGDAGAGSQADGRSGNAQGRAGISPSARPAAPESLVSFLTRNGGVYDDGGDLASMGAGKLRVGFLRKAPDDPVAGQAGMGLGGFNSGKSRVGEPMQLDYAREKAIEAGYLPPGSDLTDFKAAIGEDLRGNRQYVPEDWAAHQAQLGQHSDAEAHAMDMARADVAGAAERIGATLHPVEEEHAARLAMLGIDPHEAVLQAATASQRDYLAGRTFTSELGMPANVTQRGLHVEPPMPPNGEFLSREDADTLMRGKQLHADRIATFQRAPGVGAVLKRGPVAGTFDMPTSSVPSAIWSGGKGAAEKVSAFLRAKGDPEALQNFAAFDLRKAAVRADGTLDPRQLTRWLGKHSEEMAAFPALRQKFDPAAAATKTMDDAAAAGVEAVKAHQASALGRFLGDADPVRTVTKMLTADDAAVAMSRLAGQVKDDPSALAGLRSAVMQRYLPLVQGGKFDALPKAFSKESQAISRVLLPAQVDMLKAVQADLQRSQQSLKGTKLAGQSNTTPDAHAMVVHGSSGRGSLLSHIIAAGVLEGGAEMAGHVVSAIGGSAVGVAAARLGTTVAGALGNALRQAGLRRVDDLVDLAAAHPGLARVLMMKAPATADADAWAHFRRQLAVAAANAGVAGQRKAPPGSDGGSAMAVPLRDLRRVSAGYFGH